jgi:hypothetical protein
MSAPDSVSRPVAVDEDEREPARTGLVAQFDHVAMVAQHHVGLADQLLSKRTHPNLGMGRFRDATLSARSVLARMSRYNQAGPGIPAS